MMDCQTQCGGATNADKDTYPNRSTSGFQPAQRLTASVTQIQTGNIVGLEIWHGVVA